MNTKETVHQRFTKLTKMASAAEGHAKLKLVIDCDAGIDDAQAIIIALSQDVDVLAITCTFGNAAIDQVTKNVLKILEVCGRTDIPVYRGAHQAMLGKVINLKVHLPIHFFAYIHVRRSKIERIYESMIRWVHTNQRHNLRQDHANAKNTSICCFMSLMWATQQCNEAGTQ